MSVSHAQDAQTNDLIDVITQMWDNPNYSKSVQIQSKKNIPDGVNLRPVSPDCEPRRVEERILREAQNPQDVYKMYNNYFKNCEEELSLTSPKGVAGLIRFSQAQYRFTDHPQIKTLDIQLANGTRIPAVLALKPGNEKRPFVVVKCGVFCSADESSSTKNYLMNLFDESPFNILLLANRTAYNFIQKNNYFSIGGDAEGYETSLVGKWLLEESPYKDLISSLHFMGISLGGNSAMMQPFYNELNKTNNGESIYKSVSAICPVVNLQDSLNALINSPVTGLPMYYLTKKELILDKNHLYDIGDTINENDFPIKDELTESLGGWAALSLTRRGRPINTNDFFAKNNFFNYQIKTSTPTLVWASKDDMIVYNNVNAGRLKASNYLSLHPQMGVVNMNFGNHCGFNSVYGNAASSMVLRSFVLYNSPEYREQYRRQKVAMDLPFPRLRKFEKHIQQKWLVKENSDLVNLKYKLFKPANNYEKCPIHNIWYALPDCYEEITYNVPIEKLKTMGVQKIPQNAAEAQALTRELNSRIELWGPRFPINGKPFDPQYIVWRNY
jgi:hypothetical protein